MDTSENRLILACLRAHCNTSDLAGVTPSIPEEIAWPKVLSMARRQGIVPLVYESLSRSLKIPENAQRELKREFHRSAAHSFLYAAELARLSDHLQERRISALAFKGPTLALSLYKKISLRTVRDLDLLVAKDQVDSGLEALQTCGYEPVTGLGGERPSVSSDIRKHMLLAHHERGFAVELHWAIAEPSFVFPLSFEQIWAERQMVVVMDEPVATFSREYMLLMMCAHGTNHCWGSLKWICDIAQAVIAFCDLDWKQILARAHTLGSQRMLLVGLSLANEICGVQLPTEIEPHVRSEKVTRICREVQTRLFVEIEPVVDLERTLRFAQSRERFSDRLRILLRFVRPKFRPNARDRALIRLPHCLQVLYFPLRLFRLIPIYWKRAVLPILQGAMDRFAPIPPE